MRDKADTSNILQRLGNVSASCAGWRRRIISVFLLRYTQRHTRRLREKMRQAGVDRVHAGCGDVFLPGWLNVFFEPHREYGRIQKIGPADFLNYNLLTSWPFEEASLAYIAGCHVIEHFSLEGGLFFARECYRVMKPGGVLRLSCPDLEKYATNYVSDNDNFFNSKEIRNKCLCPQAETRGEIFISKAYDRQGAHKWFYDFASLRHILKTAGFKDIQKKSRLEGRCPELGFLETPDKEEESLYVEAVKGGDA